MHILTLSVYHVESKAPGGLALGTFPNLFGPSMSGFQSHPQSPSVYMKMPVRALGSFSVLPCKLVECMHAFK